jgi:20S proteasome subunit beta 7
MSEAEAEALLKEALAVCYYRDKQSINKFQIAKVTAGECEGGGEGGARARVTVSVSEPFALETTWDYAAFVNPSAHATGTW